MQKKLIFFFILLLIPNFLYSANNNSKNSHCNFSIEKLINDKINYPKIKKIDVEVNKNKKWLVNSLSIAIGNFRYIPSKYKKKYGAKLKIEYENNLSCNFKAKIRFNGDVKDHVDLNLKTNEINQSVDVGIINGHINGITNFKLLLPRTRGQDEILISEILSELGYLVPRTYLTEVKMNNQTSKMIFQEKSRKELLEHNGKRESAIFEGDEKFTWLLSQKIPSDNLSNYSAGVVPAIKTGFKSILSRQINSNIILKNKNSRLMSINSLSNLNYIFLNYTQDFDEKALPEYSYESYRYYTLSNELLGFNKKKHILFLDIYNLLVMSTSDGHSLSPNNRQFYWNSTDHFFEPISYDGNFDIKMSPNHLIKPTSPYFAESFDQLILMLDRIDKKKINENINNKGILQPLSATKKKIIILKRNINKIKKTYLSQLKDESIKDKNKNLEKLTENKWAELISNTKKIDSEALFVKQNFDNTYSACKSFNECDKIYLNDIEEIKLLGGKLYKDNITYQYIGKNFKNSKLINNLKFKKIIFKESEFYFNDNISYNFNNLKNEFNIYQSKPNGRAFFINGSLNDIKINYYGYKGVNKLQNHIATDINGLTGCLSFINLEIKNLGIKSDLSNCEDSINLINVTGNINKINITNAFSDALDVDFSKIKIQNININNAYNDCADFSYGNYDVEKLVLLNCGDKALSVGEKSIFKLNEIISSNSNIGIASKDSSFVYANNIDLKTVKTCLAAYNKKNEFYGGSIEIEKFKCEKYQNYIDIDATSSITKKNKNLKNKSFNNLKNNKNNLIHGYKTFKSEKTINAIVEIPRGSNEKWKTSKIDGNLIQEYFKGKPSLITYGSYPMNYGIIPQTVLPLRNGGDGDPLDILILGKELKQGQIVEVKPIGIMKMSDYSKKDEKIIAIQLDSNSNNIKTLSEFNKKNPKILEEIKKWFENYKGKNIVIFRSFEESDMALELIKNTQLYYKKHGVKKRS